MNKSRELENLKEKLRPFLRKYLIDSGIDISSTGMFKCISKLHVDDVASARLLPDLHNQQYYCYGCNSTGDIFTAHNELADAPLHGPEFLALNLYRLAESYNIYYEPIVPTEEQVAAYKLYSFNRIVADLLVLSDEDGNPSNTTSEHLLSRGWDPEICNQLRISTVIDYDKFIRQVQQATKLSLDDIVELGVKRTIFGPDILTITLFDEFGRPIGFSGRWMEYTKGCGRPKFINTSHNEIFKKGELLYGLHLAKKNNRQRCDIFEGYGSFISARQAGHKSCVSTCGTALTKQQVHKLVANKFSHINLVFDPDKAGTEEASKHMEKLAGNEGLRVTMTLLPAEEGITDPDDFIRLKGLEEFYKLKPIDAFEYFLNKEANDVLSGRLSKPQFVTKMLGIIQNTSNRIERGQQIKSLAHQIDIPEVDIRDELERLVSVSTDALKYKLRKDIDRASNPDELIAIVEDTKQAIENTVGSKEERIKLGISEVAESFIDLTTVLKNKKAGIQGWVTGFDILDERLSGIPKPVGTDDRGDPIPVPGLIFGVAGAPQAGKSTIIQNLAYQLARRNQDICILYWSLDDSRERTLERMMSIASGVPWRKITRRSVPNNDDLDKLENVQTELLDMIRDGRLLMKDHSTGNTIPLLRRWLDITREQINKPCMIIIDSFHKIGASTKEASMNEYTRTKHHSQLMKEIAQTHKVTILCSLELNKSQSIGSEPTLAHITETRKIEYDFDIIATVYNDYYDMNGQSSQVIQDPDTGDIRPFIKFNIKKSKDGGCGPIWFALNQDTFEIRCYSNMQVEALTSMKEVDTYEVDSGLKITPFDKGKLAKTNEYGMSW
jgi:DNA primase catalytic core